MQKTMTQNTPPISENRDLFYNRNSDIDHARILVDTGQELIQYYIDSSLRIWYNDLPTDYEPHCHTALEALNLVKFFEHRIQIVDYIISPVKYMTSVQAHAQAAAVFHLINHRPKLLKASSDFRSFSSHGLQ